MKRTKLTNLSLKSLDVMLTRDYDPPETRTSNKFTILGGQEVEFSGKLSYVVNNKRMNDLKVDIYE